MLKINAIFLLTWALFGCQAFATPVCEDLLRPPIEISSAVGVIKDSQGRILLLKRISTDRSYPNKWSFPGGGVDPGETAEMAVVREVKEETGLDVTISKSLGVHESLLENRNRKYVIHAYELQVIHEDQQIQNGAPEVVLSGEHQEFKWVENSDIQSLALAGKVTETLLDRRRSKDILITAGSTKEPIDDVRYITNFSKGSLGYALAIEAAKRGDHVTVLAPKEFLKMNGPLPANVRFIPFFSTRDLQWQLSELSQKQSWDIVFHAAAVSDYTIENAQQGKISSDQDRLTLNLVRTPKLIQEFRNQFGRRAFLVGFKLLSAKGSGGDQSPLVTLFEAAKKQLRLCRTNLCVANFIEDVSSTEQGVHLVTPEGGAIPFHGPKSRVASQILDFATQRRNVSWFETLPDPNLPSVDKTQVQPLLRLLQETNLLVDQNGNTSLRVDRDHFLISPRGVDKSKLTSEDFSLTRVDIDRAKVYTSSVTKPSIDSSVAGMLYAHNVNLQAMIHTHSKWFLGKVFKTNFPYPCGVKEEGLEIINALETNNYDSRRPFVVEMVQHGYILGLTSHLTVEKLQRQWMDVKEDTDQHWNEIGVTSDLLKNGRLTALLSTEGIVGSVYIHSDGSVSPRIHPRFQGMGLGRSLVQKIIAEKLVIRTMNACAVEAFYKKHGFQVLRREGDVIWMTHAHTE